MKVSIEKQLRDIRIEMKKTGSDYTIMTIAFMTIEPELWMIHNVKWRILEFFIRH